MAPAIEYVEPDNADVADEDEYEVLHWTYVSDISMKKLLSSEYNIDPYTLAENTEKYVLDDEPVIVRPPPIRFM